MTRPDSAHGQGCGHQRGQVVGGSGEGGGRTTMVRSCSIGPSEEPGEQPTPWWAQAGCLKRFRHAFFFSGAKRSLSYIYVEGASTSQHNSGHAASARNHACQIRRRTRKGNSPYVILEPRPRFRSDPICSDPIRSVPFRSGRPSVPLRKEVRWKCPPRETQLFDARTYARRRSGEGVAVAVLV